MIDISEVLSITLITLAFAALLLCRNLIKCGRLLQTILTLLSAVFGVIDILLIALIVSYGGVWSTVLSISVVSILIFILLKCVFKKRPKVWHTPEGEIYTFYKTVLEESTFLSIVGDNPERCLIRDGLINHLLYQSPIKTHFVFIATHPITFEKYRKLPHIKADTYKASESYGVLYNISTHLSEYSSMVAEYGTLAVFIEDYDELLARNNNFSIIVTELAKKAPARIKLFLFSKLPTTNNTIALPTIYAGKTSENNSCVESKGTLVYQGVPYVIPPLLNARITTQIDWWVRQYKRTILDKRFDIPSIIEALNNESSLSAKRFPKIEAMTGLQYESYVANKLKKQGFTKVIVTSGSGDYGADIIAYDRHSKKTCVQCKKYHGSVGIAAVQEIIGAKAYYGCERAIVITTATFTPNAKKLAQSANVELIEHFR